MRNRIFSNKITSTIGIILLLCAGGFFVWHGKATFESVSLFITGLWQLIMKDPQWVKKRRNRYREESAKMSDVDLARDVERLTNEHTPGAGN